MIKKSNNKSIDLTLINNKRLIVDGFGEHRRGESKAYPEKIAESLLNNTTWQKTKDKTNKKGVNDNV